LDHELTHLVIGDEPWFDSENSKNGKQASKQGVSNKQENAL
jgi:hypothetical protein